MNPKQLLETINNSQTIHFIGIGGISMSSLAIYSKNHNKVVTGSDTKPTEITSRLESLNISVFYEHESKNVQNKDIVVYSHAIDINNPELVAAKASGATVVTRAQFLGAIMLNSKNRIGISGCHGKSTTTAMISSALENTNKDPFIMCGAYIPSINGCHKEGNGPFVFEACEYKDSFLSFSPNVSVILNVGYDHVDYFKDINQVKTSFAKFAKLSSEEGGSVIVNADDKNAMDATKDEFAILFGINNESDYTASNIKIDNGYASFDVLKFEEPFINIHLSIPGYHNIYNALAAITVLDLCGLSKEEIENEINTFTGISRRFECIGKINGACTYLDYAHHPNEIVETIKTAQSMTSGKIITIFEPHTYSRTKRLYSDFINAFKNANVKIFTDIYPARETDTLGTSSQKLANAANGFYAKDYKSAYEKVKNIATSNDIVLILGAGPIEKIKEYIEEK